jgi:hypothetical protein
MAEHRLYDNGEAGPDHAIDRCGSSKSYERARRFSNDWILSTCRDSERALQRLRRNEQTMQGRCNWMRDQVCSQEDNRVMARCSERFGDKTARGRRIRCRGGKPVHVSVRTAKASSGEQAHDVRLVLVFEVLVCAFDSRRRSGPAVGRRGTTIGTIRTIRRGSAVEGKGRWGLAGAGSARGGGSTIRRQPTR